MQVLYSPVNKGHSASFSSVGTQIGLSGLLDTYILNVVGEAKYDTFLYQALTLAISSSCWMQIIRYRV